MSGIELEPVDRVEMTILIDNVTDPLLVDQRWAPARSAKAPLTPPPAVSAATIRDGVSPGSRRLRQPGPERSALAGQWAARGAYGAQLAREVHVADRDHA
jgi:hypothetical protein